MGLLALVGACSSGDAPAASDAARAGSATAAAPTPSTTEVGTTPTVPAGGYDVRTRTETLVDATRATPELEGTGVAASDERTLVTTFTYPDAAGPFPLIAFSHGNGGHPRKFSQLFEAWAAAGFVVVAPTFPLSNDEVPGSTSVFDLSNQPGDVSHAITAALRMNGERGSFLEARVDPDQIGVGGMSLGGATTYMLAFDRCCRDPRVDAVIVMDGYHPDFDGMDLTQGLPLLILHADADPVLPYTQATEAFAAASPPKYLVTIHEDVHSTPYEDAPDPADEMVLATTTAFWRLYLAHDDGAAADLTNRSSVDGLTTVVEEPA